MTPSGFTAIESRHNERFKYAVRLARLNGGRRREERIFLDGVHLIQSYLARFEANLVEVYVTQDASAKPEVERILARLSGHQVFVLSPSLMNELAVVDSPVGIVAVAPQPSIAGKQAPDNRFWLVLEGVQDPGNMGSILRTAAASGVNQVWLARGCTDPWAAKCLRGGMGAQFLLPVAMQPRIADALAAFQGSILATVPTGGTPLYRADLRGDVALLFGGEGAGLSTEILALAKARVSLPMSAGVESLNLGAAVAACCFERLRQLQFG